MVSLTCRAKRAPSFWEREMTPEEEAGLKSVRVALAAARAAAALDRENDSEAAHFYRNASSSAESAIEKIRGADCGGIGAEVSQLSALAEEYSERAATLDGRTGAAPTPAGGGKSRRDLRRELPKRAAAAPAPFADMFYPNAEFPMSLAGEIEPRPEGGGQFARVCWRLRSVRRTLQGGWLSPGVFVPSGVYTQTGARVVGLSQKLEAYEGISQRLQAFVLATEHRPPLAADSAEQLASSLAALRSLNEDLGAIHDRLHRSFPSYVAARNVAEKRGASAAVADTPEPPPPLQPQPRGFAGLAGTWSRAALAVGRSAVAITRSAAEASSEIATAAGKSALSAYERAKNVIPERLTQDSSERLLAVVELVCVDAQILGLWEASVSTLDSLGGKNSEISAALAEAALFFDGVVTELFTRDLGGLMYMARMVKGFTQTEWSVDSAVDALAEGVNSLSKSAFESIGTLDSRDQGEASGSLEV